MDPEAFIAGCGSAVEAGQASVLAGAGLSAGAGYRSWEGLLGPVAAEFGVPAMDDLPLRAQYIENRPGGRGRFRSGVVTAVGAVVPEPLWCSNGQPVILGL
ncbi:hypothetical protein [Candidatus Poriferisodalis sp.]|uniref:hypothetical protein n=1 Tax=Candidatus Poriferisodalis sp. TaxID=3101277 RepID=UPI003B021272